MFKALIIGDPHLASHDISSRKDDYFETCKKKLTFVMKTAILNKVNAIIIPGDLYHDKSESLISRSLDAVLYSFLDVVGERGIKVLATVGNHDMQFHNPDVSKRPFGLLSRAKPVFVDVNQCDGGCWLWKEPGFSVAVTASPFVFGGDSGPIEKRYQYLPEKRFGDFQIHLSHGSLIPYEISGDFKFMDITNPNEIAALNPNFDLSVNGHIHWLGEDNLLQRIGKRWFLNPGSLTRGALKMENLTRSIYAFILSVDKVNGEIVPTFDKVEIPHQKAEEIFDVNDYLEGKKKDEKIQLFIDQLRECSLSEKSSNNNIEQLIQESDVPEDVKSKAKEYVAKLR